MARLPKTPPIEAALQAVIDRFETRGPVRTRAMFGGHGVWCDDRFVAVVWQGTLYLKVDPETRPRFEAVGSQPFQPFLERPSGLNFYSLPTGPDADPAMLDRWLDMALTAAGR